tara:strand:- start:923 stop:1711 length:789 start_codon:yes stop_codon:yes gene_type:complete
MEIKEIRINSRPIPEIRLDLIDVNVSTFTERTPPSIPAAPPVTVELGSPIVDIPGCVEVHTTNNRRNEAIKEDDPKGTSTICDAGLPSFNPLRFEPEQMIYTGEAEVPPVKAPEAPEVKAPSIPNTAATAKVECPTEAQKLKEPVGTLVENGTKKIIEYRLVGKECIPVTEEIGIPDQIIQAIPTAGAITTTAGIAVVATTSALLAKPLADILLKVVKPTVKKVIKKIAAIRGKQLPAQSLSQRRVEQRQRNLAIRKLRVKE